MISRSTAHHPLQRGGRRRGASMRARKSSKRPRAIAISRSGIVPLPRGRAGAAGDRRAGRRFDNSAPQKCIRTPLLPHGIRHLAGTSRSSPAHTWEVSGTGRVSVRGRTSASGRRRGRPPADRMDPAVDAQGYPPMTAVASSSTISSGNASACTPRRVLAGRQSAAASRSARVPHSAKSAVTSVVK